MSEERHPLEGLYELTSTALRELALEPEPRRASAWFMAQALELLGYSPRLRSCAACERPLPADAAAAFSAPAGGCLGPECAEPGQHVLPAAALKVLRLMVAGDLDLYRRLRLDGTLLGEVEWALEAQLEHHLDRRLRSLRFLRQLYQPPVSTAPFEV